MSLHRLYKKHFGHDWLRRSIRGQLYLAEQDIHRELAKWQPRNGAQNSPGGTAGGKFLKEYSG